MPILRRNINQSSFTHKLHAELFTIRNFRVQTLSTSRERIATMRAAFQSEVADACPAGLFLFAEKGSADVLQWENANGERQSLG